MSARVSPLISSGGVAIPSPRGGVLQLDIQIYIGGRIIAEANACPLLDEEIAGMMPAISSCAGPELIETVAGAGDRWAASKADAIAPLRSHAKIRTHPEMLEIEGQPEG